MVNNNLFKKCRHPFIAFFYFFVVFCLSIAIKNPVYSAFSFFFAFLMNALLKNFSRLKIFLLLIPFFVFLSCLNPIVSHWGNTVIFYIFGDETKPFTLEAFCYGLNTALTILTIILWFFAFNKVLTSEKLTFIFAPFFPSVSIMFVMILRLIPFYRRRATDIEEGRKGLGMKRDSLKVLSAVTSSTLEDGSLTAQSMVERGWGKTKRTNFLWYKFGKDDLLLAIFLLLFVSLSILCIIHGAGTMTFYPEISTGNFRGNFWNCAGLISNTILMINITFFCKN